MEAEGSTIAAAMADLVKRQPAFARHVFDEAGFLRPSIVFLHDGNLVRSSAATSHALRDGDEIVLTNALSGG
jgi:sulfur carrier protein ThiS